MRLRDSPADAISSCGCATPCARRASCRGAPTRASGATTTRAGSAGCLTPAKATIAAGTSQVQRNIIAKRILGQPK